MTPLRQRMLDDMRARNLAENTQPLGSPDLAERGPAAGLRGEIGDAVRYFQGQGGAGTRASCQRAHPGGFGRLGRANGN